jgi:hypothetical protein
MTRAALFATLLLLAGCHGAGPYGHSPDYAPIDDESAAVAGARDFDPVMYDRQRDEWKKSNVTLFGIVDARTAGPGGSAMLKLAVHRLEPRNLCANRNDDDSCRVTVSDKDFGVVYVLVQLRAEDDVGPRAVGTRSLLRVVGQFGEEVGPSEGAPVIHVTWYRHWPANFYVTSAMANEMRQ